MPYHGLSDSLAGHFGLHGSYSLPTEYDGPEQLAKAVYEKIVYLAKFARTKLHLPFADLDTVNPSFAVIQKYCELMIEVLKGNDADGCKHAKLTEEITIIMKEIAEGVVERDDKALIDAMSELDDFFYRHED